MAVKYSPHVRQHFDPRPDGTLSSAGPPRCGAKTVTHLRCVQQAEALDWSADYKLFSRSPWRARDLFDRVSFEPVDLPAKPKPKASEEEKKAYQKAKEQNNLCLKSLDLLRDLRQRLVVAPTPYRLSPGMPRYYRQPAYILVTDHDTVIEELLQWYCDRWQIEVNHRDEKQHIGIADAQVWNDDSVDRLPAFLVCTYAMLMLATLRAYGPTRTAEYQTPPRWQNKRRKRPSCVDMLRKLREEASQNPQVEQEVGFKGDLTHIFMRAA